MHVDGFRLDLASILAREADGSFTGVRHFAADRYPHRPRPAKRPSDRRALGRRRHLPTRHSVPGRGWHQWNGRFRDEVQRFVRGDPGMFGALMLGLYGSDDLFPDNPRDSRRPYQSVNYVDLPRRLHSLRPRRVQRDATTWRMVTAIPLGRRKTGAGTAAGKATTGCPRGHDFRKQQAKNLFCLLLLANGIPMFAAGDEFLRTQRGNNNPYNQDNEMTWLDWSLKESHADYFPIRRRR